MQMTLGQKPGAQHQMDLIHSHPPSHNYHCLITDTPTMQPHKQPPPYLASACP